MIDKPKYSSYWNWVDEWLETVTKEIYTGRGPMRVKNIIGPKDPVAFKESLSQVLIRREKEDVRHMMGIPDRLPDTDIYVPLTPEQKRMYNTMYDNLYAEVFGPGGKILEVDATNAVGKLVRLKQIALAPEITLPNDELGMTGCKLEHFKELFDEARDSGQKIAFFSQWGRVVRRMRVLAYSWGHHFEWFTGKDHPKEADRWKAIDAMSNNPDCTGIMSTMAAGGESVDMIEASVVIFSDFGWTKKEHDQAIDRCDRGGQKKMVSVYRVIAEDTVESWICKMQSVKGSIFENSIPVTAILEAFQNRTLR
jgi:SNF2 family DNA or RNA helicase